VNPELLIFDLDGTLIDSGDDIVNTINLTLAHYGHPPIDRAEGFAHIGGGVKKLIYDFFPETTSDAATRAQINDVFMQYYSQNLLQTTKIYDGVVEFLSSWNKPIALVTNKPQKQTYETLAGLKLDRFPWSSIFAADTLPERKPHPLPLLEAIQRAGVEPHQALMIGDGIPDMEAAQRANVPAVACLYGYTPKETLASFKPSAMLQRFSDLPEVLAGLTVSAPAQL
jgi:phosphoglycolate phosphatase